MWDSLDMEFSMQLRLVIRLIKKYFDTTPAANSKQTHFSIEVY